MSDTNVREEIWRDGAFSIEVAIVDGKPREYSWCRDDGDSYLIQEFVTPHLEELRDNHPRDMPGMMAVTAYLNAFAWKLDYMGF